MISPPRRFVAEPIGSELVSVGNAYLLRVRDLDDEDPTIELSKRNASGPSFQCRVPFPAALDGNWHHLAGVAAPGVFRLYFDGVATGCAIGDNETIVYDLGSDLWVGRHGDPAGLNHDRFDFEGNIDEVRIYTRALNDLEIAALARGAPGPVP